MRSTAALFGLCLLTCSTGRAEDDDLARRLPRIPPTAPAQAPATVRIRDGFQLNLAAAEPVVADPVCASYDADGRLYVAEMRGYPFPEKAPTGCVRLLVDDDHDGKFERSTVFLPGLSWPTSVLPYDGGVFVAAAPDLLYAKDTDGDGVADVRRVVFTGFGVQNVQQLLNGLCWGLDGWVHGAAAGNGGTVTSPGPLGIKPVTIRGRDFRFKPDGSAFEAVSGGGQFGHVYDDWGRLFVCNNRWHARQIVLESRYLANNPDLAAAGVIADIASDGNEAQVYRVSPPEPWRVVRSEQYEAKMKVDPVFARRLAPAERNPAGFFSSASGLTLYRGTAFPPEYRGNLFVCDVAGNLVHRKTLSPAGAAFRADRAEPGVKAEFLASTDIWFRPVNLANTPDGTLLVLDMYRETIEHPLSIPDDIKTHLDLLSGQDRGRLYEVVPDGLRRRAKPAMSKATTADLVKLLGDPDAWWRETAQRLLRERNEPAASGLLVTLAKDATASPLARLHALWTLENLGKLDEPLITAALADPSPGLRENAAQLAESRLESSVRLTAGVRRLARDPDARVRFQAALSLGFDRQSNAVKSLAEVARVDAADRWTRTAVLSACRGRALELAQALAEPPGFFRSEAGRPWLEDLAVLVGSSKDAADDDALLARFTGAEADPALARSVVLGLGRGLPRAGRKPDELFRGERAARLKPVFDRAATQAKGSSRPEADRVEAVRLLALAPAELVFEALPELLDATEPPEVQVEAVRALGASGDARVSRVVLDRWKSLSPAVRREAAEVLLARADRVARVLDAIEAKALAPSDLDPLRRKQLREHARPELRERAVKLLAGDRDADRAAAVREAKKALELAGDRERGRAVYRKVCATCHRAEGQGVEVGPNLETVAARAPEDLLTQILDPNREVAPAFVNYNVATKDGGVASGLVAEETGASVVLKRAEGVTEVIPRARIDAVSATGLSLMPEGLERTLSSQDLADVVSYVRTLQATAAAGAKR